jgi:hypothetical protein
MQAGTSAGWGALQRAQKVLAPHRGHLGSLVAMAAILASFAAAWMSVEPNAPDRRMPAATSAAGEQARRTGRPGREILIAGYAGGPLYHRSDVHLVRPGGTDLTLKGLGWDGDALYFPIDGGIRSVEWWGSLGFMVDFLHNKAISRLGRGAHGRKLADPVIETVDAEGAIGGKPAPAQIKLTDVLERFEFTHGHNTLIFTGMIRPFALTPSVRPYFGAGFGFAIPHVEVWFPGGKKEDRTNEYQYAGPAAQGLAGIEFRRGNWSYVLEYKLMWASIEGALTGDESFLNFMMPGDLARQFMRWWKGEEPRLGRFETTLTAHTLVGGAGYWWQVRPAVPAP